jgi:hypothetical protein
MRHLTHSPILACSLDTQREADEEGFRSVCAMFSGLVAVTNGGRLRFIAYPVKGEHKVCVGSPRGGLFYWGGTGAAVHRLWDVCRFFSPSTSITMPP